MGSLFFLPFFKKVEKSYKNYIKKFSLKKFY